MSGSNTYSGLVTVGGANAGSTAISADGGSLALTGGIYNPSNNLTLTGSGTGTISGSSVTMGSGALTKSGTGTWYFASSTASFTGNFHIDAGIVNFVNGGLGTPGSINLLGGTLQYATGNSQDVSGKIVYSNSAGHPMAIDSNGNNDVIFASGLNNTNTTGLTKLGAGTLSLSASNSYSGATVVAGGTLAVNGSIPSSSSVTVGDGVNSSSGTLAGSGTVGGTVHLQIGGTITAGSGATTSDSIGTLTTGRQTWSGGAYVAKISSDGLTNDMLQMSGLTISASTSSPVTVALTGLSSMSPTGLTTQGVVLATDSDSADAGVFRNAINALTLVLSATNITTGPGYSPELAEFDPSSGGEELVAEAAPEPTSFLLLGAVISPLLLGRRPRRSTVLPCSKVD